MLKSEGSVFSRELNGSKSSIRIILLVYVDDVIFSGATEIELNEAVDEFLSEFEGNNEGKVNWNLGVKIHPETNTSVLSKVRS